MADETIARDFEAQHESGQGRQDNRGQPRLTLGGGM